MLVHQKNYHQVQNHLKEVIPTWYEEYVKPEAKAHEGCYPGPPEVSPIEADGRSQSDHTYLTISINTAMSISSNISNDSPPTFIYRREQQSTTGESTLRGSQANSSNVGRSSWEDKVCGFYTSSSSEPPSTAESEQHQALQQELATSREEVAALKERLAKIEGTHAQDQAIIEAIVQHQVSHALQERFKAFTHNMIMFSQMMMAQQNPNKTKRRAAQLDDSEEEENTKKIGNLMDGAKRWDNKDSPWIKTGLRSEDDN